MRQFLTIAGLLLGLTVIGTLGFWFIEDAPLLDCLYMSVITLTTVGYGETIPLSSWGKIFVMGYLVVGLSVFTYSASLLGQRIMNVQVRALLEKRRMQKAIQQLDDHFIICGAGRMGMTIGNYLEEREQTFVMVDHDEEVLTQIKLEKNWLVMPGDATHDEILINAGVERARSLASVLPTDADNVYVALSARMLSRQVQIIARASEEKAIVKLERAGANRVVSPFSSGAVRMARFMLNPAIEDFLEITGSTRGSVGHLELADVLIVGQSPYAGKRLNETDLRAKGIIVIGIRRPDGECLVPPPGTAVIHSGDSLFAFGSTEGISEVLAARLEEEDDEAEPVEPIAE